MSERNPIDLREHYFVTLRDEIKSTKARIFTLMVLGIAGAPVLAYFSLVVGSYMQLIAPFVLLVLLVLYLAEQTELMRAGRYIRENIECGDRDWEHWVGSLNLRSAERQLFAMFVIVCLIFYVMLLTPALQSVMQIEYRQPWFEYYFSKFGLPFMYAIGTLWALFTLARFWRAAVSTSD
ncbi:MAG: hypothetical protein R3C45_21770 [Phycisphaerales bacterium]